MVFLDRVGLGVVIMLLDDYVYVKLVDYIVQVSDIYFVCMEGVFEYFCQQCGFVLQCLLVIDIELEQFGDIFLFWYQDELWIVGIVYQQQVVEGKVVE